MPLSERVLKREDSDLLILNVLNMLDLWHCLPSWGRILIELVLILSRSIRPETVVAWLPNSATEAAFQV